MKKMLSRAHEISDKYVNTAGREEFKRLIDKHGSVTSFEHQTYTRDGRIIWVSESARAVLDEQGALKYYEGIVEDITQRKQVEEALRLAEAKYRNIFESAVEGIFRSSPEGQYVEVNLSMAKMFGFVSPHVMCQSISDIAQEIFFKATDRDEFIRLLEAQDEIKGFEYQACRKDGTVFWVSEWARAIRDIQGNLLLVRAAL